MLKIINSIKKEIKYCPSSKVDIIIYNRENDLYETCVEIPYDDYNSAWFTVGKGEKYNDAVKRAKELYEELKYANPTIITNNEAQEGDTIVAEGETDESLVIGRYYEGGEVDNGVRYLDSDGVECATFDGCYTIVKRGRNSR